MENNNLEEITTALKREEKRLADEVNALKSKIVGTESELTQIQAAIKQLAPKKSLKRRQSKPAVSTETVRSIIKELSSNGITISQEELKTQVASSIERQAYSKVGFALRFKQALQSNKDNFGQH